MDMANLNNEQQAYMLDTQLEQQRMLSDQAATNAGRQFNASSQNQINQFNSSLAAQIEQFNTSQYNAMQQFNTTEANRMTAIEEGNLIDVQKFNNQLATQIRQFDAQQDYQRDQWNAANAQAVEQSNVEWRRRANTIDTAAQNAVNQQTAQQNFQATMQEMAADAQSVRDDAAFVAMASQNRLDRISRLFETALGSEWFLKAMPDKAYQSTTVGGDEANFWDTLKSLFEEPEEDTGGDT